MKKKNLSLWLSLTAVIIAIAAFVIVCCRWLTFPSTAESFIGILVSLLALCVTFAIGYQIVNTLDIKESVKDMIEFKQDLESTKKELINVEHGTTAHMRSIEAYSFFCKKEYTSAIVYYLQALISALKGNDGIKCSDILDNINNCLIYWKNDGEDPKQNSMPFGEDAPPIDIIIPYFEKIINECSKCLLYNSHIDQINKCKASSEQIIKEHDKKQQQQKL